VNEHSSVFNVNFSVVNLRYVVCSFYFLLWTWFNKLSSKSYWVLL